MIHQTKENSTTCFIARQLWYKETVIHEPHWFIISKSRLSSHVIGPKPPSVTPSEQQMHVFPQKRSGGAASTRNNGPFLLL